MLLQGCFNQVLGVVVLTVSLCDATVPRTFKQVPKILYKVACTMPFGLDIMITSVNFWEELETPSAARDRLDSFLALIDDMVHHAYMLHV